MTEDKELTTEEKADNIGKKVVDNEEVKEKEEDVPDYEVIEEPDAEAAAKSEDDEESDKRLSKSREDRGDKRHLSNREKRQLRKKRLAEKFDAKDQIIRQQQEQINALGGRLNEVDGRLSQVDQAGLVKSYEESVSAYQAAERMHQEAFSTGDGAKATEAMRKMYEAQKRIDQIEDLHARNQANQTRQPKAQQKDPILVAKATSWAEKNPWFKQGGSDDDSAIADTIASKLVKEGFDPRSDDYWDELDERLAKKGIGPDDDDEEDDEPRQRAKPQERRKSPPVGAGSGRGDLGAGKVSVSLPTVFINALKQSGIWDDPARRNKAIREHQRIKAEGNR